MRIHQWQVRGPDRSVQELLPETPPTVVGHGILEDNMLYLTARRAEDGMLFRVFLNPDDLRRLLHRAIEQDATQRSSERLPADGRTINRGGNHTPSLTATSRLKGAQLPGLLAQQHNKDHEHREDQSQRDEGIPIQRSRPRAPRWTGQGQSR